MTFNVLFLLLVSLVLHRETYRGLPVFLWWNGLPDKLSEFRCAHRCVCVCVTKGLTQCFCPCPCLFFLWIVSTGFFGATWLAYCSCFPFTVTRINTSFSSRGTRDPQPTACNEVTVVDEKGRLITFQCLLNDCDVNKFVSKMFQTFTFSTCVGPSLGF